MMMDDSAPTRKRRKLAKTYNKVVLLQKRTVVAKVCMETYSKRNVIKRVEKRPQTYLSKGNAKSEIERDKLLKYKLLNKPAIKSQATSFHKISCTFS